MIEAGLLKNLLLNVNPRIIGLSEYLNQVALLFVIPAFYVGMIIEYFTSFDFQGVAKRAFVAVLAIKLLIPIHVEMVDQSLNISSKILSEYSRDNKFLTAYQNANVASDSHKGVWDRLKSIVSIITNDHIVISIFLVSYGAFFLLTQLYGLIYHLTLAFIGLCAVLSIFPMTAKSLRGAIYSSLWCVIMPFVVMIVLSLVGDSDAFLKDYEGGLVQNIESLIQLLVMMIILLMTPFLTSKIMNGTGLNSVADNIGQMAAMATMVGGASYATKLASSSALKLGGAIHNVSSKPLMNRIKENLSKKAGEIAKGKNLGPSLNSLTNDSFRERVKGNFKDFKDDFSNTSWKDKAILGADSLVNRKENSLASMARKEDALGLKKYTDARSNDAKFQQRQIDGQKIKMPISSFKEEARNFSLQDNLGKERFRSQPNSNVFLDNRNRPIKSQRNQINFRDSFGRPRAETNPFVLKEKRTGIRPESVLKFNSYQSKQLKEEER